MKTQEQIDKDTADWMRRVEKFSYLEQKFPSADQLVRLAKPFELSPIEAHRSALLGLSRATEHLEDPEGMDWPELLKAMRVAELVLVAIVGRYGEEKENG